MGLPCFHGWLEAHLHPLLRRELYTKRKEFSPIILFHDGVTKRVVSLPSLSVACNGKYLAACLWTPASRRRALLSELDLCKRWGWGILLRACCFGSWSSRLCEVRLSHLLSRCRMMMCSAGWNLGHDWDLLGPI